LVALAFVLVLVLVREPPRETGQARSFLQVPSAMVARPSGAPFALLLAIGLAITLALGLLVPVLTLFGTNVLKVSLGVFALILLPPALVAAIALVPAGRWADRRGRHRPLFAGLALIAIPFWGAALSTQPLIVSAGGSLAALGYALFVPAWNALIMDWIPAERRGFFLGGVATVQGLGLAFGPLIGGRLFEINPYAPFWLAGLLMTVGAGLAAALIRLRGNQKERLA
jgi:MFS family permease